MEERRNAIVDLINRLGRIDFNQLKEAFPQVSEMTLRTDLKVLDEERRIVRVHGGAKSVHVVIGTDDLLGKRAARNTDKKNCIAMKALELLRENSSVYLDSGSTTTALAHLMTDGKYQIFTNSISCVMELSRLEQAKVLIPGGCLNRYSMSLCGTRAIQDTQRVNFDLCFIGVTGYSKRFGFTCGVEEESQLKRVAIERSEKVVILMDSSKEEIRTTFTITDLSNVDVVISDGNLSESFLAECKEHGVTVL